MTNRRFIARPIVTGDNTDPPVINQAFTVDDNFVLRAVRATILIYNNPTFTNVSMKLYASRGGLPVKQIAQSTNVRTKAQLTTLTHAHKETFFTFDHVPIRAGTTYHLGLVFTGYTGSQSSHCAWASSWPDPPYQSGLTINQAKGGIMPLSMTLIGSDLP